MGHVYKARDPRLGRTVALKVVGEHFSDRFHREATAIASLNHPNICTLYDIGPNYLVMEYIQGTPLSGPIPQSAALRHAEQILNALEAAHRCGIVHRDLKPANILKTDDSVKVVDFGLAKMHHADVDNERTQTVTLTAEHTAVGTPHYMAPEQIEGGRVDARTDIFGFGCVLYELLTGGKAFNGSSAQTVMAAVLSCDERTFHEMKPAAF